MLEIRCETVVESPPEAVYEFLADLENHWRIAGSRLVTDFEPDGDVAVVRFGPPGFRRTATTRIDRREPGRLIEGRAASGASDGDVRWRLEPTAAGATRVRFEQDLRPRGVRDRVLVAWAGRWWLPRQYRRALQRLGATLES